MAQFRNSFLLRHDRLLRIRDDFIKEAQAGLRGEKSSCLMMPSMMDVLPNGEETGVFFAVDIGGTNYRVILVSLSETKGEVARFEMEDFAIPEEYFSCHATRLFDLLADSLVTFAKRHGFTGSKTAPVGFCFSFPVKQTAVDAGTMIKLTKKFDNEGLVGCDPVQMLQQAIQRFKSPFKVVALLNDSVGTLAGGSYEDSNCKIGVILGTGTNACYAEQTAKIRTLPKDSRFRAQMVVNTEWGNFWAPTLPITQVDRELDETTPNAGEYHFEKMVSGMYMGEAARRIILRLAEDAQLFGASVPDELRVPWALSTPSLAKIAQDGSWLLSGTAQVLADSLHLPAAHCTFSACSAVKEVCVMVSRRSAAIVAACLAGLLRHIGRDDSGGPMQPTTIAIDGGLFEHYTAYRGFLREYLDQLLGPEVSAMVELKRIRDASSMGSAYLAAAVTSSAQ
ncbi:g6686 [Coccomyxa elongata]